MAYETVESKITYNGAIIDVKQDLIRLPNGKNAKREIVLRGEAAGVLPVLEDGSVVLIKQYRHSVEGFVLEIPAGMLDSKNEEPRSCAIRELEEETGYKAEKIEPLFKMHSSIGFCTEAIYIYLASGLTKGETDFDDEEFIETVKIPLNEAIEKIHSGEITDSKTIAALFAHKSNLSKR